MSDSELLTRLRNYHADADTEALLREAAEEIEWMKESMKSRYKEIERLRSLLASQPRTKDGKIVVDGMGLYPDKDRRGFDDDIMQCHAVTQANWISDDGQTWTDDPSEFYSEPQQ